MKLINYEEDKKVYPPIGRVMLSGASYVSEVENPLQFFGYYEIEENENVKLYLYKDKRNNPKKKL
jgi:hypothetical protein